MGNHIKRRSFLTLLGGAAAAWPVDAKAQQRAVPAVGVLHSGSPDDGYAPGFAGFRAGLNEAGFVERQNVVIEYRWALGQFDRLPALADELVRNHVAIIVATGGVVSALAAKAATSTIPIVFAHGSDPIKFGLVASFNRPGGNITGVSFFSIELEQKRLELHVTVTPRIAGWLVERNVAVAKDSASATVWKSGTVKTGTRLCGQCPIIVRISATPMIARYTHSPSRPAPSARRCAALGLDRSARPSKRADRAVDANL